VNYTRTFFILIGSIENKNIVDQIELEKQNSVLT